MNRFNKSNLWADFAKSLDVPIGVDARLRDAADLVTIVAPLLRNTAVAAIPVTETTIAATIVGSVVAAAIAVPALMILCNLVEQETQLQLAIKRIYDDEIAFDNRIQLLADRLHITLPVKQVVNIVYQVSIPPSRGFNGDPIVGSGGFHDVTVVKSVSYLWSLGPAVAEYLTFRLATPCTSPDILYGVERIGEQFRLLLCPDPLIITEQSNYQRDLDQGSLNLYNSKNSTKINNTHTWDIRSYINNYNTLQKFLNQENGSEFKLFVEQFVAMHIQTVVKTTISTNMAYSDCTLLYLVASNNLKIMYANDLKQACEKLNVDDASDHVRVIGAYLNECGQYFLPVPSTDIDTSVVPEQAPYGVLNSTMRADVLKLRPIPVLPSIVNTTLSNFKIDQNQMFIPRIYSSNDVNGGTAVLYETRGGIAIMLRTPSKELFHLQSLRETQSVIVSPVVYETGIRKLRVYSNGTNSHIALGNINAFRTLFHIANAVIRQDTGTNNVLYAPDVPDIPLTVPVCLSEHTFIDLSSEYTGPKTSLLLAGMALVAGTVSSQTRIVQTSNNNGLLLLMKGALVIMGLVAAESSQIRGVYSDSTGEEITHRGQDVLDDFRMASYIDRQKAIDAGYRISGSQQEALYELRRILKPEQFEAAEKVFLYRDFIKKNHESIIQHECSGTVFDRTNDVMEIPVDQTLLRQHIEGSAHMPDGLGPHPTVLDISGSKSYTTLFYEGVSNYLEALHYEVTSSNLYLLCQSAGSAVANMDVDIVGMSLAATAGAGYVYMTTRQGPTNPVSTGIIATVGVQTHLQRFEIMPMVSGIVVRTGDNIKWLAQGTTDGVYNVVAAVSSVAGAGVSYIWRKTVSTTVSVAQSVILYAVGAGAIVLFMTGKRKRD
jgi:hypothetical protein